MTTPGCGSCRYFHAITVTTQINGVSSTTDTATLCRRFPPTPAPMGGTMSTAFYPPVRADNWCGEYAVKPDSLVLLGSLLEPLRVISSAPEPEPEAPRSGPSAPSGT